MSKIRIKPSMPVAIIGQIVNSSAVSKEKVLRELIEQIEIRELELKLLKRWLEQVEQL